MTRAAPRIPRALIQWKRKPSDRVRPKHREFIRSLPCLACGKPAPSECAHVRSSGGGGTGIKPADRFCVPLCGPVGCHHRQHQIGEARFFAELGIDAVDVACRLWTVTGDTEQALRTIARARQTIELKRRETAARRQ